MHLKKRLSPAEKHSVPLTRNTQKQGERVCVCYTSHFGGEVKGRMTCWEICTTHSLSPLFYAEKSDRALTACSHAHSPGLWLPTSVPFLSPETFSSRCCDQRVDNSRGKHLCLGDLLLVLGRLPASHLLTWALELRAQCLWHWVLVNLTVPQGLSSVLP